MSIVMQASRCLQQPAEMGLRDTPSLNSRADVIPQPRPLQLLAQRKDQFLGRLWGVN
jgi:hypothetical protein